MKEKYVVDKTNKIKQLIAMGIHVTATNEEIHSITIDKEIHKIADIETITGLKFKKEG